MKDKPPKLRLSLYKACKWCWKMATDSGALNLGTLGPDRQTRQVLAAPMTLTERMAICSASLKIQVQTLQAELPRSVTSFEYIGLSFCNKPGTGSDEPHGSILCFPTIRPALIFGHIRIFFFPFGEEFF